MHNEDFRALYAIAAPRLRERSRAAPSFYRVYGGFKQLFVAFHFHDEVSRKACKIRVPSMFTEKARKGRVIGNTDVTAAQRILKHCSIEVLLEKVNVRNPYPGHVHLFQHMHAPLKPL
jgi:hypothetical protein